MAEININSVYTGVLLRKIAFFGSSQLGNDIYFLKEFVDITMNLIGEETLIQIMSKDKSQKIREMGKTWNEPNGMKNQLKRFDRIIEETKVSYDLLEDKDIKKKTITYQSFLNKVKRIPIIKQDFYALFIFLVENTSIQKMTIPQEYFKILQQKGRKDLGEVEKRRVGSPPPTRP